MKRFNFNKSSKGITFGLLVLPLSFSVHAAKREWRCLTGPEGKWKCDVVTKDVGPVFGAKIMSNLEDSSQDNSAKLGESSEHKRVTAKNRELDWIPLNDLAESFRKNLRTRICKGTYVEPEWPGKYFQGDSKKAPITADSDHYKHLEDGTITLTGNVLVKQGNRIVRSDQTFYNKDKNLMRFQGNVKIRQPGFLVLGDKGTLNTDTKQFTLYNAKYLLYKGKVRGGADKIERHKDGTFSLENAYYTSSVPKKETWIMKSKHMTLDPTSEWGKAKDTTLHIEKIPVFYSPYLTFPLTKSRKTGLLYPSYTNSSSNGVEFAQPIYFNIAPNIDDTFTATLLERRGALIGNQFRYLNPHFHGSLEGSYLTEHDKVRKRNPFYRNTRWLYSVKHKHTITEHIHFTTDYTRASDENFLNDFGDNGFSLSSQNPLYQHVDTTYDNHNVINPLKVQIQTQQYQNMTLDSNRSYERLPQINLQGQWNINNHTSFDYLLDATHFSRAQDSMFNNVTVRDAQHAIYRYNHRPGFGINRARGDRFVFDNTIQYRTDKTVGSFEAGLQYRAIMYRLSNLNLDNVRTQMANPSLSRQNINRPHTIAPTFHTAGRMYFERLHHGKTDYTHTLEPRIQYVYTPYRANQNRNPVFDTVEKPLFYNYLWEKDRFAGYDRIGDTNHITLGLESRIINAQNFELFRFGIGQIRRFRHQRTLIDPAIVENEFYNKSNRQQIRNRILSRYKAPSSPVATEFVWNISSNWSMHQYYGYDTHNHNTDHYTLGTGWQDAETNKLFNLDYRYSRQPDRVVFDRIGNPTTQFRNGSLNAAETSFSFPLHNSAWKILTLYSYDLADKRSLARMIGLEKSACSYRIRFVFNSYIDPMDPIETARRRHAFTIQFVLYGLGSVTGNRTDTLLKKINGYKTNNF